ncbi:MAG: response regulator [Alcaligenaceae bacterium]|nr:MAG: response regulator [Alcaligenaceae bacterium]
MCGLSPPRLFAARQCSTGRVLWKEEYLQAAPLNILMVEDEPNDAELVTHALRRASLNFTSRRVDSEARLREELIGCTPDIILSDFSMPRFNGIAAFAIVRELCPDVPFIFVGLRRSGNVRPFHEIIGISSRCDAIKESVEIF